MIPSLMKAPLRRARNAYHDWRARRYITEKARESSGPRWNDFDFGQFKSRVLGFVRSLQTDDNGTCYRYAHGCSQPSLYASAYACMTLSLLGEVKCLDKNRKEDWIKYFDCFQNHEDGLFYDPVVMNTIYSDSDWWGARHLATHLLSVYTDLGARPRYPFKYLTKYHDSGALKNWLDGFAWFSESLGVEDVDNKIMNIGCQLQFQRDAWSDGHAADALDYLKGYLRDKINRRTGMWGGFNTDVPEQRSRMVQFAYHLFPLYFYDGDFEFEHSRIVTHVLQTQNFYGGYGVRINSSACEDIDSIDLLIRFAPYVAAQLAEDVRGSLERALDWVMLNQMEDGGFVFRLAEPFHYGSAQTSSYANMGAMLPTWFRTLSLAYLTRHLGLPHGFRITRAPGCEM